ncbi:MAG: hypothetical protein HN742_12435 [Lentisphaerae bacterium]|jgi:hypothetical protein|nr:hypothetical protein [Lentisphaerota bacterium]MBT4819701.1 hypothetical protein [Lentisphaerota bacterium]MBT5605640.1 hypothetical protein [Lentisphaerota bacterium]MBT7054444.1 hypothetical protein [Lentisphaerota bacterium]MBT7842676.1 hypothetical protein [Lentisphaerota bacterium]
MSEQLSYAVIIEEIDALEALIPQIDDAIEEGAHFLVSSLAPNGPVLTTKSVSPCHKMAWGLYEAGRTREVVRILEWLDANAKQAPGEYYFPEEQWYEKDMQRVYRTITFGRIAEYLHHPAFANDEVRARIKRYQHSSGGVANCIDDGFPEALDPLNTTFFGHWALAAGLTDEAIKAGDWIAEMIELNAPYLAQESPAIYYTRKRDSGELVTDIPPDGRMNVVVDTKTVKQPSWVTGTCMAYLADLYTATGTNRYLDAALSLVPFETQCTHRALFWPSKCKVGWGAAQVYRLTTDPVHRKIAANVARSTFMMSQRSDGSWPHMFYPLKDTGAWRQVVYGGPNIDVPEAIEQDESYCWLSSYEITGEFLGELGRTSACFSEVLARLRKSRAEYEAGLELRG